MLRISIAAVLLVAGGAVLADDPAPEDQQVAQTQARSVVCPHDTGSHIKQQPGDCLSSPGRTYGSEELRSTGAINNADALRRVDPSLTTSH